MARPIPIQPPLNGLTISGNFFAASLSQGAKLFTDEEKARYTSEIDTHRLEL